MSNPHYPTITEASLTPFRALEVQLSEHPDILDRAECPYTPNVKIHLRRLLGEAGSGSSVAENSKLLDAADRTLDDEIADLYRTVKNDAAAYTGNDVKDKVAFLKVANDLLTKIVDLQARRINIKNMATMQRIVVETMEACLSPADRTTFIERIGKIADV